MVVSKGWSYYDWMYYVEENFGATFAFAKVSNYVITFWPVALCSYGGIITFLIHMNWSKMKIEYKKYG